MEKLIMKPFNGLYFMCWIATIMIMVGIRHIFKNKTEKAKKIFIVGLCGFLIAIFFAYKAFLSVDKNFLTAYDPPLEKFNWFSELPFHLCNINMFLIPVGVCTNKRSIMGFSFFLAPLGATMALLFPDVAFSGYSILMPRMLGYYITHFLIVIAGMSLALLDFYKPEFKDFYGIFGAFIAISAIMHTVNIVLVSTGICENANYFYTMNDAGISILHLFYKAIPLPFLYLLPALPILAVYMCIVSLVFLVIEKTSKDKEEKKTEKQPAVIK